MSTSSPSSSTFPFPLLLFLLIFAASILAQGNNPAEEDNDFAHWLPQHVQMEGGLLLLDRRALSEGEVLLFRTKKSRHRAIPVMRAAIDPGGGDGAPSRMGIGMVASRFSDALTFKDWLRRAYQEGGKALKVSVRSTEVVRPVLQHLYATRSRLQSAPIIVHANTFEGAGPSQEKPVDVVHFVDSARQLLPDAVLSLGWTQSEDWAAVNRLDWRRAFQLLQLLRRPMDGGKERRQQPAVLLNMRLNDAVHSAEVLEWLLGIDQPPIYLLLRGDVGDFVDSDSPLKRLAQLSSGAQRRRLLFDVDESWRTRMRRYVGGPEGGGQIQRENALGLLDQSHWLNWLFPSSAHHPLSTSVLSPVGVAFLGWPNSLLLSTRQPAPFPARQSLGGRVMFLPKREHAEIIPQRRTGMIIYLFDQEPELLFSPRVPNSIQAFIGYDGRISLENHQNRHHQHFEGGRGRRRRRPVGRDPVDALYPKSSTAQLPKWGCYAFWLLDKGWRVEMEVWTEKCSEEEEEDCEGQKSENDRQIADKWVSQRTFLQLDTPIGRNRRSRNVAIGKSGDGAVDFLARGLQHNGAFSLSKGGPGLWPFLPSLILVLSSIAIVALFPRIFL